MVPSWALVLPLEIILGQLPAMTITNRSPYTDRAGRRQAGMRGHADRRDHGGVVASLSDPEGTQKYVREACVGSRLLYRLQFSLRGTTEAVH